MEGKNKDYRKQKTLLRVPEGRSPVPHTEGYTITTYISVRQRLGDVSSCSVAFGCAPKTQLSNLEMLLTLRRSIRQKRRAFIQREKEQH